MTDPSRTDVSNVEVYHHPDALFDMPYEKVCIPAERYTSFRERFGLKTTDDCGVTLQTPAGAAFRIEAYAPGILRMRISPDASALEPSTTEKLGLLQDCRQEVAFSSSDDNGKFSFTTDDFTFILDHSTNDIRLLDKSGKSLIETVEGGVKFSSDKPDYGGNRFLASFDFADENVFGFGGRIMHPNRTGTTADIFAEKVGKRSGDYGGFPIPFFMSTKGYGLFLNNPWPHVYFDMGKTRKDQWFMHAPGGECDIFIIAGPEFGDIVQSYTQLTGRIPLPRKALLGFWCSSLTFVSAAEVVDTIKRLKDDGYPCDVVVLDGPWRGGPNFVKQYSQGGQYPSSDMNWHPDFGDGPAMVKSLEVMNVKTCLHLNSRNFHPDTAEPAVAKGLLRRQGEETVARVTDKKGEEFYKSFITPRIEDGITLWWTDHADRVSGQISQGLPSRNIFGVLWNRLLARTMAQNGIANHVALTRGSGIGGQKYGLPWPGDTRVGIDAFEEDVWFCLNAGLTGYSITSVDLAGFTLRKDPKADYADESEKIAETFDLDNICRRLCQSIFFIPTPRIHNNWDTLPRFPWNCPPETRGLYKSVLRERYKLTPYIFSYALNASRTGEPILRPLVYHYRTDSGVYDIGDEFFMGQWLLVAPVVKKGQISRNVYLPEGKWTHLWSEKQYTGPCLVKIDAPLYDIEGLPVFVKAGAIIPRQHFALSMEDTIPKELTLDVYPNGDSQFKLHESDTITNVFTCSESSEKIVLDAENNTDIDRLYKFRFHGISQAGQLLINGRAVQDENVTFDGDKKILEVEGCSIAGSSSVKVVFTR